MTYFNTASQIVSAANAGATFSTKFTCNNFDLGAVQVIWSGLVGNDPEFQLSGSIDGDNWSPLADATTFTTANSSQLYRITDIGYQWIQCVYTPATTGTYGAIDIWVEKKSRR